MASRTTALPRNEKERFETPPLVSEPGQRSLISPCASMKLRAKRSCSCMPVATARMFASKMSSSGRKPASPVSRS